MRVAPELAQLERRLVGLLGLREVAAVEVDRALGVFEARHRDVPARVAHVELTPDPDPLLDVRFRAFTLAARRALECTRRVDAHMEQAGRLRLACVGGASEELDRLVDAAILLQHEPALEEEPSMDGVLVADPGGAEVLLGGLERTEGVFEAARACLGGGALAHDSGARDTLVGARLVLPQGGDAIEEAIASGYAHTLTAWRAALRKRRRARGRSPAASRCCASFACPPSQSSPLPESHSATLR